MADLDVATTTVYVDDIFADPVALELDDELDETEDELRVRLTGILQNSATGDDLFDNCIRILPNSANSYGLTLTMNRAIKYLVSISKLAAYSSVGWKRLPQALKVSMKAAFQSFPRGSNEWNSLIITLIRIEKPKKTLLKRFSSSISTVGLKATVDNDSASFKEESVVQHNAVISQIKSTVQRRAAIVSSVGIKIEENKSYEAAETNRLVDRIALLSCALVDPILLEMWTDIAAPIPACERPAGTFEHLFYI